MSTINSVHVWSPRRPPGLFFRGRCWPWAISWAGRRCLPPPMAGWGSGTPLGTPLSPSGGLRSGHLVGGSLELGTSGPPCRPGGSAHARRRYGGLPFPSGPLGADGGSGGASVSGPAKYIFQFSQKVNLLFGNREISLKRNIRGCSADCEWAMESLPLPDPEFPSEKSSSAPGKKFRVLVGVTGSVAALKLPLLVSQLLEIPGLEVKVVTTERAKHFYNAREIPVTLYSDEDEWQLWKGRSDPVLHIELRRWADLMVVAPLDANTLAKLANGICDNLLTCVIRAWDLSKPLLFCPAMNTAMWEHPLTARHVEQLKGFGYTEVPCVVKKLVCGDEEIPLPLLVAPFLPEVGQILTVTTFLYDKLSLIILFSLGLGAMAEVGTIVESVRRILAERVLPRQS